MPESTPPEIGLSDAERDQLTGLRNSLLGLHKLLIDLARLDYERAHGRVASPGQFLEIVMNDPWFAWLSPLTSLIVRIDEGLASEELMTSEDVKSMSDGVRALLVPSETGTGFARRYDEAMQRDPAVVLAHGDVMRQLAR